MFVSFFTISIIGLVMGFIFSVPVAGPVSIMIASHALRGEGRYCMGVAVGAAVFDFLYCFVAVYGFSHLYLRFERIIPYILIAGSLLIFYYGFRILRTRLDLRHLDSSGPTNPLVAKAEQKSGFRVGLALNFLNPSLIIGWLTSSFIVLSLAASLGFHVDDLDNVLSRNLETIKHHILHHGKDPGIRPQEGPSSQVPAARKPGRGAPGSFSLSRLVYSLDFALFVGSGTILWFYYFSGFLIRHRKRLNINALNRIIQVLGVVLCLLSVYLIYFAARMLARFSQGVS